MSRSGSAVSDDDAGTRLDLLLAAPLGSRSRAQRLIESGRVRVDGEVRPKRHMVAAGASDRGSARRGPRRRGADVRSAVRDRLSRTSTCWWSKSRRGSSSIPPAATGTGRCRRRWREPPPAATSPTAPESCTGSTATPRGCSWSPARTTVHRRLRVAARLAQAAPRVPRAGRRPAASRARARSTHRSAATGATGCRCRSTRTSRARPARTSRSKSCSRTRRSCGSCSTPGGPTRSASTWRRSGSRSAAIRNTGRPARYGLERQFLHAARLEFDHPVTGERVDVRSELPEDLREALERARGE